MNAKESMPFSGSALKWIAILIMAADHIGASLLEVFVINYYGNSPLAGQIDNLYFWINLDSVLRAVGRTGGGSCAHTQSEEISSAPGGFCGGIRDSL